MANIGNLFLGRCGIDTQISRIKAECGAQKKVTKRRHIRVLTITRLGSFASVPRPRWPWLGPAGEGHAMRHSIRKTNGNKWSGHVTAGCRGASAPVAQQLPAFVAICHSRQGGKYINIFIPYPLTRISHLTISFVFQYMLQVRLGHMYFPKIQHTAVLHNPKK